MNFEMAKQQKKSSTCSSVFGLILKQIFVLLSNKLVVFFLVLESHLYKWVYEF